MPFTFSFKTILSGGDAGSYLQGLGYPSFICFLRVGFALLECSVRHFFTVGFKVSDVIFSFVSTRIKKGNDFALIFRPLLHQLFSCVFVALPFVVVESLYCGGCVFKGWGVGCFFRPPLLDGADIHPQAGRNTGGQASSVWKNSLSDVAYVWLDRLFATSCGMTPKIVF